MVDHLSKPSEATRSVSRRQVHAHTHTHREAHRHGIDTPYSTSVVARVSILWGQRRCNSSRHHIAIKAAKMKLGMKGTTRMGISIRMKRGRQRKNRSSVHSSNTLALQQKGQRRTEHHGINRMKSRLPSESQLSRVWPVARQDGGMTVGDVLRSEDGYVSVFRSGPDLGF